MEPKEILGGRFEIAGKASDGGMAAVYHGFDRHLGIEVAVKVFQAAGPRRAARFAREAALLAELSHPAIVRYVAHGSTPDGAQFLAMEWIEGESLRSVLRRRTLTVSECAVLGVRVAKGLEVAHRRGVIHRDLKPSNLMLPDGALERVKLIDFGVARHTRDRTSLTRDGAAVGTPRYMAPEQARGEGLVGPQADVFALGAVLYESLVGRPAFCGDTEIAIQAQILWGEVPPLRQRCSGVPVELDRLIELMLAKEADDRPADLAPVIEVLAPLIDDRDAVIDVLGTQHEIPTRPLRLVRTGTGSRSGDGHDETTLAGGRSQQTIGEGPEPAALTGAEQRVASVVLSGAGSAPVDGDPADSRNSLYSPVISALRRAVEKFGARAEVLSSGAVIVTLSGVSTAVDQAARAARCALAMRSLFPDAPMVLATGRGVVSAPLPLGEVVERSVAMLDRTPPAVTRLDEVTAGLLDARFYLDGDDEGLTLAGERGAEEPARTVLGRTVPFVGRRRELATLEAILDECAGEGVARTVLVTGPAGAGKSRLCVELLSRVRARDDLVEVLVGSGDSLSAGAPFGLVASALRRAAGLREGEPLEVRRRKLRARVSRHLSDLEGRRVSAFLGEALNTPFAGDDEVLRAARRDPRLKGDGIRAAWQDWLAAETRARPVLLVLENLEWGDLPSITLVDAALRNLRDAPLMVLGLARPEVHVQFPGLWAGRDLQEMRLAGLTRRSAELLVREAVGADLDPATASRLVERADGNPFYLEELVRAMAAGSEELPDTVLGMVQSRLDAFGDEAKRVLRAASIFGETFWRGGVVALLGDRALETADVDEWLEDLVFREAIERRGVESGGEVVYGFRHPLLREAAYAMLTDEDRVLGHRLAAEWLEQTGSSDAVAIAEHFHRGEAPRRAVGGFRIGAEQALEGNDLENAIEWAERGIACGAEGDVLGALRLLQAEALRWRGEHALAEVRAGEAAASLAPGSADWFRTVGLAILASGQQGRFDVVEGWLAQAAALDAGAEAHGAQIICLCRGAVRLLHAGRGAALQPLLARIGALARSRGLEPMTAVRVHQTHVVEALQTGDLGAMLREQKQVVAIFDRARDFRNACVERSHLGLVYAELGDFARAEEMLRLALGDAERLGLPQTAGWASAYLAAVLLHRGELARATDMARAAADAGLRQKDPRLEGSARTQLSSIALRQGDAKAAAGEASRAETLLAAAPPLCACAMASRARALVARGLVDEARKVARAAMGLLESLGGSEGGESMVRLTLVEAEAAAGDEAAARAALASAHHRLEARAARISDPELRRRFLEEHPDNRRTRELARAWGL